MANIIEEQDPNKKGTSAHGAERHFQPFPASPADAV